MHDGLLEELSLCEYLPHDIAELFYVVVVYEVFLIDNEDVDLEELVRVDRLWRGCRCGR